MLVYAVRISPKDPFKRYANILVDSAIHPFDDDQPFEAVIIDDEVTICWISMSYNQHSKLQAKYFMDRARARSLDIKTASLKEHRFRSTGSKTAVTEQAPVWSNTASTSEPESSKQYRLGEAKMEVGDWDDLDEWMIWDFQCLPGYKAYANVGVRTLNFEVRGEQFFFVPDIEEDVFEEKWKFSGAWWCS
jgi:hypothetical protein